MSVAGAMAGSCVSLMKHWEDCCVFQGSGGSLACQDPSPGWRGGCQRAPRSQPPRSPLRLVPLALRGLWRLVSGCPSAQHACLLLFHPSPACSVTCLKLVLLREHLSLPRGAPLHHSCIREPCPCSSMQGVFFPVAGVDALSSSLPALGCGSYLTGLLNLLSWFKPMKT